MIRLILFLFIFSGLISGSAFSVDEVVKEDPPPLYSSYLKGFLLEKYGDFKGALKEYQQAARIDKDSTSIQLRIAAQYIKMEDFEKAEETLLSLKEKEKINLDAYLLLIFLYSHQSKEKLANKEYEEMLSRLYQKNPENIRIAESLAQFKLQDKKFKESIRIYRQIIKIKPNSPEAHFWLGYLYEEEGDRNKAIRQWRKTLELDPDHVDTLNALGYTYAEEGIKLDAAENLVKKALELKPGIAAYLDSLGWVYYKKQEFDKAKEYIEQAAAKLQDPVIYDHLGDIYYVLEEFQKAKEAWEKVLINDPENEKVKKKLESIAHEISTRKNQVNKEENQ